MFEITVALSIIAGSTAIQVNREAKAKFLVAKNGNDAWSGKLSAPNAERTDGPFATLKRARDAVREMKAKDGGIKEAVTIMVRGGKYFLDDTLVLTQQDNGTAECRITYTAYPGEKPVISGGRQLSGWKPYKEKILKCEIPEAKGGIWKFRNLFLNGECQIRARYPNLNKEEPFSGGDWVYTEGPEQDNPRSAFIYKAGSFPRRWAKPRQGEIYIWPYVGWGDTCMIPIRSIDYDKRLITMVHPIRNFDITPWFYPTTITSDNRFRVENLLEELDEPGEWCLDSEDGILYFWPPVDSLQNAEVVAPVLNRLIDLRGCSYVTISGFVLTETRGGDTSHPAGLDGLCGQGPELQTGLPYCGEAIHLENTSCCIIENNHIYAVGGNGIYLQQYNHRNIIRYNEISEVGANGVVLAGGREHRPGQSPKNPLFNEVTDNHIHHCATFDAYCAAVFLGFSESNVIAHNDIHDMPHHGINLGNDGYGRNFIEYNKVHRVTLLAHDTGAINCWMSSTPPESPRAGHFIRYNLIYDNPGERGIYLDDMTSNCFVYGNIIIGAPQGVILRSINNIVENNIFVGGGPAVYPVADWIHPYFFGNHRFCRNIIYHTTAGALLYQMPDNAFARGVAECDYNLFFNTAGGSYTLNPGPIVLDEWRKQGFDEHSVVADPLFVDPANDDYRLKPESPAFKLGFQPIDVTKIGIRYKER